ncbi:MAG: b-glycosyltransferase [Bacteroidota bacterium]|nr:b-glycosyltransferase [Bacteroidota bacterium]
MFSYIVSFSNLQIFKLIKLSIVIVNYNVRYFLEQALHAVYRSKTDFEYEIFVVDNNSTDDSVKMVQQKFPDIKVIANRENFGFSKANNQAIKEAKGEYILLLNPDTVIREDTLQKCVAFMDQREDAGGLGVKMFDGTGKFLPESKRGFPSPLAAFAKMTGFARLFPNSETLGKYHLTYLNKNETHEVDVLSGAFMLLRKRVLDKVGLLDEDYFMYGEDIDISYRIKNAGYKNYYFAETSIIHFKGESTKKGSLNYVRVFYNAMIIFSKKHVGGTRGKLLSILLNIAIYVRAFMAIIQRIFEKIGAPVFDMLLMFGNLYALQLIWENYVKLKEGLEIPDTFLYVNIPIYVLCWLFAMWLAGVYDKNAKWLRLLVGLTLGVVMIAALYAFFPLFLRTSRGIIIVGFLLNFVVLFSVRLIYKLLTGNVAEYFSEIKNMVIVGTSADAEGVWNFIQVTGLKRNYIGFISDMVQDQNEDKFLGASDHLEEIVSIFNVEELIFCADAVSAQTIIDSMSNMGGDVEYKIASENSVAIIGSNSKDTSGDLYTFDIGFNLNKPLYRRLKRLTDILVAFTGIVTYPVLVFFVRKDVAFFSNCFPVLFNQKTWVGYDDDLMGVARLKLPELKRSVISISDKVTIRNISLKERLHVLYAKEYSPLKDLGIIVKHIF